MTTEVIHKFHIKRNLFNKRENKEKHRNVGSSLVTATNLVPVYIVMKK